jgi:SAM-dependent methyltransferase
MLGDVRGKTVLYVDTSHGSWFDFLGSKQFKLIYGVEIDPERARLAKSRGYAEIYNCDAADVPLPNGSIDCAVSNDVFVHILRIEDKAAVLKKIENILKPGGIFILNHTISKAFNHENYTVQEYCSYLTLHEFISLITNNTKFEIIDIKPTFFSFRGKKRSFLDKVLRHLTVTLPLGVSFLFFKDYFNTRSLGLQESDTVYIKLRKRL